MKLNILIVDDEYSGRNALLILLKEHCHPYIDYIACASNLEEAYTLIHQSSFDICFLDIQLNNEIGFDLVDQLTIDTQVVYVTAFEKYAFQAIKNKVFDYLLKPVNPKELVAVFHRVNALNTEQKKKYLNIKEKGATVPILQSEIIYVKANGPYSEIQLLNGRIITTSQTLKSIISKLNDDFIRVHKSYAIRKECIVAYNKSKLFIDTEKSIPLSRTGLKLLQELFSQ